MIWRKNVHIMNWVAIESQSGKLKDYALMQGIKESSTLRVSPKKQKSASRIVYRYRDQENEILNYLRKRDMIKNILKNADRSKKPT